MTDAESVKELQQKIEHNRRLLSDQISSLDDFERRSTQLSTKLYNEVNGSRMRPFATAMTGFKRMVRDLARDLGKDVDLEIAGGETPVDRDVLERLKAPMTHLLRNSLDHGVEKPEQRAVSGKPLRGIIRVEASHGGGLLKVSVKDDGKGIDLNYLRKKVLQKGLVQEGLHLDLTEDELIDFLFLPDFSTRDEVTEISGRGVGLDVVRDMVREIGGSVNVVNDMGRGAEFVLLLPLSLSILSAVIVEISGESYAFPVTRIDRLVSIPSNAVHEMNGSHYLTLDGQHVGLISGSQVLGFEETAERGDELKVVVVSDRLARYGIVVDRVIGQRQISVQALDTRLGKVKDISAAALLEDGSPTLIMDIDDVVRSIDHIVSGDRLGAITRQVEKSGHSPRKRILIVEDSLTVREVERELLQSHGYHVETAIDGVDGWNAVRESSYDLVISDIDMPRMDGIALVKAIKQDLHLKTIPVMIVSYKDRKEDRQRGLDAGADYYLTKGSFHDDTLMEAVIDLIGEAAE
jgi:two-component system sensor histidine kinase and response regulator WspE